MDFFSGTFRTLGGNFLLGKSFSSVCSLFSDGNVSKTPPIFQKFQYQESGNSYLKPDRKIRCYKKSVREPEVSARILYRSG